MEDAELAAKMAAAENVDPEAYRSLFSACLPLIVETAKVHGHRDAEIDVVVRATVLRLHAARRTYRPSRPFMSWLMAIALRLAAKPDIRRRRRPARSPNASATACSRFFSNARPR